MNDSRSDVSVGDELESEQLHPGLKLAQARERKNLGVEVVASRLNIPLRYVVALENGEYDKLPGLAFARGYIRAYAKLLGLSSDELIAEFNLMHSASEQPRPVTTINKVGRQVKLGDAPIRFSLWLFVIVLAGISLWWWQMQSTTTFLPQSLSSRIADMAKPSGVNTSESPVESDRLLVPESPVIAEPSMQANDSMVAADGQPQPVETLEAQTGQDGSVIESEPSYLSDEEVAELARRMESESVAPAEVEQARPAVVAPDADKPVELAESAARESDKIVAPASPASDETAEPLPAVALSRLIIEFNADCWVTVRDGSDRLLFANMKRAGQTLDLELETPGKLLVGRVSSVVRAEFDGEPLDLRAVARKDVAKVSLP